MSSFWSPTKLCFSVEFSDSSISVSKTPILLFQNESFPFVDIECMIGYYILRTYEEKNNETIIRNVI